MNYLNNEKKITNIKTFVLKYSLVGGIIMWTVNGQIKEYLTSIINNLIDPLFSMDLDQNGKPDLDIIKKWKVKVGGATFPIGKFVLDTIKTAVIVSIMIYFINYLITNTYFLERI